LEQIEQRVGRGEGLKTATAAVAEAAGLSRRVLYEAAVAARQAAGGHRDSGAALDRRGAGRADPPP
ncbi:MAG: hypothetical protein LBD70_00095, partial [Bifidobacteriaceae bacterium]|jgi:hypothetical protein|nr:hypothetical protein [Bifidobacteriaceae bacterium]